MCIGDGRFMKFKVVNFRADRISGWCQAPTQEAGKARLDLLISGEVVDSFLARNFRAELPAHDFADRNLGFLGSLPPQYWDGQSYTAILRERASGTVLAEETLQTDDARTPAHPGLSGAAKLGEAGQLNGWASYQGERAPVHLVIDSHIVSTAVADLRRLPQGEDQPKLPIPVGWGFALQVPPQHFDDAEHRIQVTAETPSGPAAIFDHTHRLPADQTGTADQNAQHAGARGPNNFPLPGLRASGHWPNRWKVSDPSSVTTRLDDDGRLRVTTTDEAPVYLMLNALPQDFRKLDADSGAVVGSVRAHRIGLTATQGRGVRLQLGVYEYGHMGHNTLRTLVEAGQRGLFVADPQTDRLLVLLRVVGPGTITVEDLEFLPAVQVRSADPGFHPIGEPRPSATASRQEALDEIGDFLAENQELYDRLAAASTDQLAPVLNSLLTGQQQLHSAAASLAARTESLNRQLQGIRTHLAQQQLKDAFAESSIDILPPSAAARPTQPPTEGHRR